MRPRQLVLLLCTCLVTVVTACSGRSGHPPGRASGGTSTGPIGPAKTLPRRGGVARVGVWDAPDVGAPTVGGEGVRALVLPQLWVAQPDGSWAPSLVEPGSDRQAGDLRSASFRLRPGAVWSDGHPITAGDLSRTADRRFVAGVEGPAADGTITVPFTHPLADWRRLWSGSDSIAAPGAEVWGGPFVVASTTPGLETVLRRNDRWWGAPAPYLDELDLMLVPDPVTARQLLAAGQLDVVMPPASTVRTAQLQGLPSVHVDTDDEGGWTVELVLNPLRLDVATRRAMIVAFDRQHFVTTLLTGEASVLDGFAGAGDETWASAGGAGTGALSGQDVTLTQENEEPMSELVGRVIQRQARAAGGTIELRDAEAARVEGWVAAGDYQVAEIMSYDGPVPCWSCRWASVDGAEAKAADGGVVDAALVLEREMRDGAIVLPLWRPRTVVAWRVGLEGVRANGFALTAAWNAWEWWRTPSQSEVG